MRKKWSGRLDLNQRPPSPEPGALPAALRPDQIKPSHEITESTSESAGLSSPNLPRPGSGRRPVFASRPTLAVRPGSSSSSSGHPSRPDQAGRKCRRSPRWCRSRRPGRRSATRIRCDLPGPGRHHEPAALGELLEQRGGRLRPAGGDDDPVERREAAPAEGAVAGHQRPRWRSRGAGSVSWARSVSSGIRSTVKTVRTSRARTAAW